MSNFHLNTLLIVVVIFLISCDEINKIINPTSEYLVDKTLSASATEQIIESGNDIKIIIPANSLNGDLGLKIKKEVSIPAFSVTNNKLGSNVYKISFTGNTAFSYPIKVIINYDKSQIPAGKTVTEIVKGYIYANSNWKMGSYVIDETNCKIIFSVSNLATPKINKDKPELQAEGDITFGDGYNTTDTGQNDDVLKKYIKVSFSLYIGCNRFQWTSKDANKGQSTIVETYSGVYDIVYKQNGRFEVNYDKTWQWSNHGDKDVTSKSVAIGYIQLSSDLKKITEFKLKVDVNSNYLDGSRTKTLDNITLVNLPEKHDPMDDRGYFSFGFKPSDMFELYFPCDKNYVNIFDVYSETAWASNWGEIGYDQSQFNCAVCESATERNKKGYSDQMCSIEINLLTK